MINQASRDDLPEILDLQFRAFGEAARRLNVASLPPLEQTIQDLLEEARNTLFFKYTENGRIIGSVRGHLTPSGVCRIGKLIVDPECRSRGIGQQLMLALEKHFRPQATSFFLFTSADTPDSLRLYGKLGYAELYRRNTGEMNMVFLEKKSE